MSASIWVFIFSRSGSTTFGASALIGPSGMPASACFTISTDSRSSCTRHFELEILVARVRHVPPQIEIHTTPAQGWAGGAQCDGIVGRHHGNPFGPHHPNRIAREQVLVFVHL